MAFREVAVFEVREVLRLWVLGEGFRAVERLAGVDRKTVRRYVAAGVECGLTRDGGVGQLNDVLLARVCEIVRPHRPNGHGLAWGLLVANHDQLKTWLVDQGLTAVKAGELLTRRGVVVPERTVQRYALVVLGVGRSAKGTTVRVADGEPGVEVQIDFGKMGLIPDPETGRRRVCQALIFTAVFSRHTFVWLSFTQTTATVIAGCEAAWTFFNGVFKVVIPDNMSSVIDKANPTEPRFNQAFIEYAQSRGFVVDPARVRTPTDKPKVERMVQFVRNSFFAGEEFIDLADAQRRAELWCAGRAGLRTHGTTQCRPAELFALEEQPHLLPAPAAPYDVPVYVTAKVHRDHHIEVAKALYSIPGDLIGCLVEVRADRQLVRVTYRGAVIKVHPRVGPGGRVTDPADLPSERTVYALRDLNALQRMAAREGPAIGAYAAAVLDHPLPWTKMRQVYALLGLVKHWGPRPVEAACERALAAEAVSVALIGRMIERATETAVADTPAAPAAPTAVAPARFSRDAQHFATKKPTPVTDSDSDAVAGGAA
jgi:transposase